MGHCNNSVVLNADADTVWKTIRDFHDMSWAPNVITSLEKVGEVPGTEPGAIRILNEAFHGTLQDLLAELKNFFS